MNLKAIIGRDNSARHRPARWPIRSRTILSRCSHRSILSIGSSGSVLSIGSAGSILSIGSAGSILSIFSAGSVLSLLSVWSLLSIFGYRTIRHRRSRGQPQVGGSPRKSAGANGARQIQ